MAKQKTKRYSIVTDVVIPEESIDGLKSLFPQLDEKQIATELLHNLPLAAQFGVTVSVGNITKMMPLILP